MQKKSKIDIHELKKKIDSLSIPDKERVVSIILTYSKVKYTKNKNGTWFNANKFEPETIEKLDEFVNIRLANQEKAEENEMIEKMRLRELDLYKNSLLDENKNRKHNETNYTLKIDLDSKAENSFLTYKSKLNKMQTDQVTSAKKISSNSISKNGAATQNRIMQRIYELQNRTSYKKKSEKEKSVKKTHSVNTDELEIEDIEEYQSENEDNEVNEEDENCENEIETDSEGEYSSYDEYEESDDNSNGNDYEVEYEEGENEQLANETVDCEKENKSRRSNKKKSDQVLLKYKQQLMALGVKFDNPECNMDEVEYLT